jgi:hypothetical protein
MTKFRLFCICPFFMKYLIIPFFLIISGCSINEDFNYTSNKEFVVINGILHPDSLITIKISKTTSYPLENKSLQYLSDAAEAIYENDLLLGHAEYDSEKKYYLLNTKPRAGSTYRLTVTAEGKNYEGITTVPYNNTASACYTPFTSDALQFNNKILLNINIENLNHLYVNWISLTSKTFNKIKLDTFPFQKIDSSSIKENMISQIYSNSSVVDRFNGVKDYGINLYSFYLRLNSPTNSSMLNLDAFSFETDIFFTEEKINTLHDSLGLYVNAYTMSQEYDKYLKSSITNYLNNNIEVDVPNPFAEKTTTYSNIHNGTGIFAGFNSISIPVHKNRCK